MNQKLLNKIIALTIGKANTPELRNTLQEEIPGLVADEFLNPPELIQLNKLQFNYKGNTYTIGPNVEINL